MNSIKPTEYSDDKEIQSVSRTKCKRKKNSLYNGPEIGWIPASKIPKLPSKESTGDVTCNTNVIKLKSHKLKDKRRKARLRREKKSARVLASYIKDNSSKSLVGIPASSLHGYSDTQLHSSSECASISSSASDIGNGEFDSVKNITVGLSAEASLLSPCHPRCPIAIDCEMVGVGEFKASALGRVSIVDWNGKVLYDVISRPDLPITDYRTPWSGLRHTDMVRALPFVCVQDQVRRLITDRIVVGHMISNDFHALQLHHPRHEVRDTAKCVHLKLAAHLPPHKSPIGLKKLSKLLLKRDIQVGEHNSVEDARATMDLYRIVHKEWEADFQKGDSNNSSINDGDMSICSNSSATNNHRRPFLSTRKRLSSSDRAVAAGYVSTAHVTEEKSFLLDEFWPSTSDDECDIN